MAEPRTLALARQLLAIARTGLHFSDETFDRERYRQVRALAAELLAGDAGDTNATERGAALVEWAELQRGYATPRIDVRAAVFDGDRVLLVRERSDGGWTLPGGYADVGLSGADNAVRETREEAGVVVTARRLALVVHRARHACRPNPQDFYKLYYLCEPVAGVRLVPGPDRVETDAVEFFDVHGLPPLSQERVIGSHILACWQRHVDPALPTLFD